MDTIELGCKRGQDIGHNAHDPDVLGYPINQHIYVEYLSADMDGIFKNEKSWRAFCNGNFERADNGEGFWLKGDLKPATVDKWVDSDTRVRLVNRIYTRVQSDLWAYCCHSDIELKWTYELSGCDEHGYPTSVEFIAVASFKNPQ